MRISNLLKHSPLGLNKGITLIEVLVTVIVLAFGLLGLAGLQANALKNNQSAFHRSQATYLAYEIIDRMRANRSDAVDSTNYNIAITDSSANTAGTAITQADVNGWLTSLARLPNGDGSITCVASTDMCTVVVQWNDRNSANTATATQQFSMSTQL